MLSLVLLVSGVLFGALFLANNALRVARRNERIGLFGTLLAFLTAATLVLAATQAQMDNDGFVPAAVLATAIIVAVASTLVVVLEHRRTTEWRYSRGLLGTGLGALVALSTLLLPATASAFLAAIAPSPTALLPPVDTPAGPTIGPTLTRSPTASATWTPTRMSSPTAAATETRGPRPTRTPTVTATLAEPCVAQVAFNLNLRAEPSRAAAILDTIPFDTAVPLFAHSADSSWWLTRYEDQIGWVAGEFLTLTSACEMLPVRD